MSSTYEDRVTTVSVDASPDLACVIGDDAMKAIVTMDYQWIYTTVDGHAICPEHILLISDMRTTAAIPESRIKKILINRVRHFRTRLDLLPASGRPHQDRIHRGRATAHRQLSSKLRTPSAPSRNSCTRARDASAVRRTAGTRTGVVHSGQDARVPHCGCRAAAWHPRWFSETDVTRQGELVT